MASWKNFVASCLRVADLVESRREPGTAPVFHKTAEGRQDALWLSIGIEVLEYLSDKAGEMGSEFISIAPLLETLLRLHPSLNDEDILFVCKLLASETVFPFPEEEKVIQVGKTALLEQLSTSRYFRLSKTGRLVVDMAHSSSEMVYSDDDARKILKAIDVGDFGRAMRFCKEIRKQLVLFSHELRKAQERPGGSDFLQEFAQHRQIFKKVVSNTQETVITCQARLKEPGMKERVDEWGEEHDDPLNAPQLRRAFRDLLTILEKLARIFAQVIHDYASTDRQKGMVFDFKVFSKTLVQAPPSDSKLRHFFRMVGPCRNSFAYAIPFDLQGCLRACVTEASTITQEFSVGEEIAESQEWVADLLDHHREAILNELGTKGHVTLQTGIDRGWFRFEDKEMLSSLSGIYRCPDSFGLPGKKLAVGKGGTLRATAGRFIYDGDDLALVLLGDE